MQFDVLSDKIFLVLTPCLMSANCFSRPRSFYQCIVLLVHQVYFWGFWQEKFISKRLLQWNIAYDWFFATLALPLTQSILRCILFCFLATNKLDVHLVIIM